MVSGMGRQFLRLAATLTLICLAGALAQAPAAPPANPPSFAVLSLRPFSPSQGRVYGRCTLHEDPELFSLEACPLKGFVYQAWGLENDSEDLVNQAPRWTNTELYTLTARTPSPTTHEERMAMLKNALESRFGLVVRSEKINREVYLLELSGTRPRLPAADPHSSHCGRGGWFPGKIQFACGTIHDLIRPLAELGFKAPVLDRTGLPANAKYKILIQLDPKLTPSSPPTTQFAEFNQALRSQLGLRLSTTHQMMPTVVMVSAHHLAVN